MFGMGWGELLIILAIVFIIFGINKLPQFGKGLGEGIRNFKSAIKSIHEESEEKPKQENEEKK